MTSNKPVLAVHGGAWAIPDDAVQAHARGVRAALTAGWAVLERGGAALDAVEAAVTVLEDDETFDAGRGSFLNREGRVQMDALLMSGADLHAGGVGCVERLRNPIQAARMVLERSPHVYFVGEGAERFVAEFGMPLIDNTALVTDGERERLSRFLEAQAAGGADTTFSGSVAAEVQSGAPERTGIGSLVRARDDAAAAAEVESGLPEPMRVVDPTLQSHDTVGAVALDARGNLAAGTSTGGTLGKAPGRVGDSSLIGCGCYADNQSAAASLTGWGEPIMKLVLGKWAVDRVAGGGAPQNVAEDAMGYLRQRLQGRGGIILLGPDGRVGLAHTTPRMAWGVANAGELRVGTDLVGARSLG